MKEKVLIDSSFLFALYDRDDKYHDDAVYFARDDSRTRIVPDVVLTEVAYMIKRAVGQHIVPVFLNDVTRSPIQLQPVLAEDVKRAREVMLKYPSAKLDFVDCCIMALAERLEITQICTFDRRDFSIYRAQDADALELLP